ncbi:hypothetical protein GE061_020214 [Apolygus lucorum]|uniref:Uncharacterized protein n=1 Tax=Apolygus lucorum TaxID=248454 RepID=A0A6A4KNA9_APOLU|nr:hypothetical protein GE061_020197 [Apolygus lucorum]KAF6197459.1 hypothetical protein GE061_020214 [Apolygus lucorum]
MSMFMCPAVHTTTRSLLRLSSTHEPSDPPLRVIMFFFEFLGELQPHGLHSPESDVFRPSSLNGYGLYRCFKKGYLQITLKSQAYRDASILPSKRLLATRSEVFLRLSNLGAFKRGGVKSLFVEELEKS